MSMQVEEEAGLKKMDKKFKRRKKKETSGLEEVTDCTVIETATVENNLKSRDDKKKKSKKNHLVGGDIKLDDGGDETVYGEGYVNLGAVNQHEKVQKKRSKRISKFGEAVTYCSDSAPSAETSTFSLSKEKKKIKKKKKHEVGGDIIVNVSRYEDQTDKDPKTENTKKRKLKPNEDKDPLNDNIQTEIKEKRSFQTNDGVGKEQASEMEQRKHKEKSNEEQEVEDGSNLPFYAKNVKSNKMGNNEFGKGEKSIEKEDITEIENMKEGDRRKKNKKRMRETEDKDLKGKKKTKDGKEFENTGKDCHKDGRDKVLKKKRKAEKIKDKDGSAAHAHLDISKIQNTETTNGKISEREKTKTVEYDSENPKPKGKLKKVRFSSHIEVFPSSDHRSTGKKKDQEEDLLRGKRFSREEDEIVKEAVLNYIESHSLGEEGLKMVLHCKSHPELKNCWKDIGAALPYRPYTAIYHRAHILFERDERHEWTEEEYDLVQKFQEKHGNNWKALAEELGKHRIHVKDTWRRIKLTNWKKGHWSQEEYQNLFDLVNMDLRMKAFEDKRSKHGMLRDNICWGSISEKLSTRSNATCCMKWYKQMTSSMVADGTWADSDDYRLLDALFNLDACCIEDVNWDSLLDHRSGDVCRKRWDQMVLHIGIHGNNSFAEQVETLAKRYCPDLLEAREAWEGKPVVP